MATVTLVDRVGWTVGVRLHGVSHGEDSLDPIRDRNSVRRFLHGRGWRGAREIPVADNARARFLQRNGVYRRPPSRFKQPFSAQDFLIAVAEGRATADQVPERKSIASVKNGRKSESARRSA